MADFIGSENVVIICSKHGIFQQTPYNHLKGNQCKYCSKNIRTQQEFIEKVTLKHKGKYLYPNFNYQTLQDKIDIICPIHGKFKKTAWDHLIGKGCRECLYDSLRSDNFKERSIIIHGNQYDYSQVQYHNQMTKVTIICPKHGEFQQLPTHHLKGSGCSSCGITTIALKLKKTRIQFIEQAEKIHGNKYDYSKVIYNNSNTKIIIICPEHREFKQDPKSHLQGSGCPQCAKTGYSNMQIEWLELVKLRHPNLHYIMSPEGEYKIGRYLCDGFCPDTNTVFEFHGDFWHGNPRKYHPDAMNTVCKKTFGELYQKTLDKRNYIEEQGYQYVEMWETDWLRFISFIKRRQNMN